MSGIGTKATKPSAPVPTSALMAQAAADLDIFYDIAGGFAQTVIYQPAVGSSSEIPAIVDYGEGESYKGSDAYGVEATMRVRASDVPEPTTEDEIVIGDERWRVIAMVQSGDGLEWIVDISKYSR